MAHRLTESDGFRNVLSANDFLDELRNRGAWRLRHVSFRRNRVTVWSITQRGTVLNVHEAYRSATPDLLDAFATVLREGGVATARSRRAAEEIGSWPHLEAAMLEARAAHEARRGGRPESTVDGCCATPAQRSYLRALYRYFNATRFGAALPVDVPVRLSSRMRSALGHMLPGDSPERGRYVVEIALNVDLMLEGNGAERIDTLLHEMAHVADYLTTGHRGHGRSWRAWARRVGCLPTTLYDRPVVFRRRRRDRVTRVPPLPAALRRLAR